MNKMLKRAIFLDFDGVLFDSLREAYCVALIALGKASCISDVNLDSSHFQEFNKFRYLIGPAWNYLCFMPLIDEKVSNPCMNFIKIFQGVAKDCDPDKKLVFEKEFFKTRDFLRETETKSWLSLITPYPFAENLRDLMRGQSENYFLITTRDRKSVHHVLRVHSMNFLNENVFGSDDLSRHNSKRDIIQSLIQEYHIEKSIFIDDFEDHLTACSTINNLFLTQARWGYVSEGNKLDNSSNVFNDIQNLIQEENVRA
jgi:phosphoglycolate phosphatase-like HAD superfamily hydrolase